MYVTKWSEQSYRTAQQLKQFLIGVAHLVRSIKDKIETVRKIHCRRKRMTDDSIPEAKLNKMIDLMNDLNTNFGNFVRVTVAKIP